MSPAPPQQVRSRSRRARVAAAAAAVLAVSGGTAVVSGLSSAAGPPQPAAASRPAPSAAPSSTDPSSTDPTSTDPSSTDPSSTEPASTASPAPSAVPSAAGGAGGSSPAAATDLSVKSLPRARPVSLSIPSIGVGSRDLVDLGRQADGSLEVPTDFAQPGWYSPGAAPGQLGPAVIAGHVDSERGPAVFYRLGELRPGATVDVGREDGTTARFVVDRVARYPKDRFPTVEVYGDTTHRAELRLITCGGAFDRATGHYVDNVVAYAHLV